MPKMLLFTSIFNIKMATQKFTNFDAFLKSCTLIWLLLKYSLKIVSNEVKDNWVLFRSVLQGKKRMNFLANTVLDLIFLFKNQFILKRKIFFKSSFRFTAKLSGKFREFPYISHLTCPQLQHHQYLASDESTLTRLYYSEYIVCIALKSLYAHPIDFDNVATLIVSCRK